MMISSFNRSPAYAILVLTLQLCLLVLHNDVGTAANANIANAVYTNPHHLRTGHTKLKRVTTTRRKTNESDTTTVLPPKIVDRSMGEKELLVIRIEGRLDLDVDGSSSTTASTDQLIDDIFHDETNVSNQFAACSQNKFVLTPANTGSPNIQNGIVTVELDHVVGRTAAEVYEEIDELSLTTNYFGKALIEFDQVMICMPPGVLAQKDKDKWIAFVPAKLPYLNYMSIYHDDWCSSVSAGMHEIGHTMGLQHAGEIESYDDEVGQMGFSSKSEFGPLKCFNPAKSWQLGWYADKSLRFDPFLENTPFSTILTGIVHITGNDIDNDNDNNSFNKNILLQIPNGPGDDLYIGYNRKDGFNSGTDEGADRVLVTRQNAGGMQTSVLLAKLDANESYKIENYRGVVGQTLVIEAKDRLSGMDEVLVDIYFEFDDETPPSSSAVILSDQPTTRSQREASDGCFISNSDGNSNSRVRFEASVVTDGYPEDTSWTLTNDQTGEIVAARIAGSFQESTTSNVDWVCLDRDGSSYTFTLYDAFKDGICCDLGFGGYSGFLDGRELFRGGEFSNTPSVHHSFVVPEFKWTVAPTLSPTHSPTLLPTHSPTIPIPITTSPTFAPTMVPTFPPSEVCEDDPNFRYRGVKTCQWVAKVRGDAESLLKRCSLSCEDNKVITQFCPLTCNACKPQQDDETSQTTTTMITTIMIDEAETITIDDAENDTETTLEESTEAPVDQSPISIITTDPIIRGKCEDDSTYLLNYNNGQNCAWVGMTEKRKNNKCNSTDNKTNIRVDNYCPSVCLDSCQNNNNNNNNNRRRRKRKRKRKKPTTRT